MATHDGSEVPHLLTAPLQGLQLTDDLLHLPENINKVVDGPVCLRGGGDVLSRGVSLCTAQGEEGTPWGLLRLVLDDGGVLCYPGALPGLFKALKQGEMRLGSDRATAHLRGVWLILHLNLLVLILLSRLTLGLLGFLPCFP